MTDTAQPDQGKQFKDVGHPSGKGFYAAFPALWYLEALGVAESLYPFASAAWKTAAEKPAVRVAVIDTPVAHRHPNLVGAIDLGLARDFSVFDTGAFIERNVTDKDNQQSRAWLGGIATSGTDDLSCDIVAEMAGDDRSGYAPTDYGGHGTAVAGLIGARPVMFKLRRPADLGQGSQESGVESEPLPFAGINPFCRIVPISTTAAPDARMVKGALDYALMIQAEVVVIAAEWADHIDRDQDASGWRAVDKSLLRLCRRAQVFCAAGNMKIPALVYPASLSGAKGRARPWAVTACDEVGRLLTYAPEPIKGHAMLRALSSEAPRFDREVTRLDPFAARDPDIDMPHPVEDYPARHLVSTDPPGGWGYRASQYEHDPMESSVDRDVFYEIGSLFCRFSGTSAATGIAAGLASLAIAMGPCESCTRPADPEKSLLDLDLARSLFG